MVTSRGAAVSCQDWILSEGRLLCAAAVVLATASPVSAYSYQVHPSDDLTRHPGAGGALATPVIADDSGDPMKAMAADDGPRRVFERAMLDVLTGQFVEPENNDSSLPSGHYIIREQPAMLNTSIGVHQGEPCHFGVSHVGTTSNRIEAGGCL